MGSVCTPVSVVTAMAGDRPHGTTVSAFASLSLDPPMVLVSLDRSSDLLHIVRRSLAFGLNVLHSGQSALASAFARKGEDKFNGIDWTLDSGVPRLDGSAGWLACRVERLVSGGDHVVVLGRVIAVAHDPAPPLTYYQRGFGTHHPHRAEAPRSPRPALTTVPLPALPLPQPAFAFDTLEEWFAFT
jgi:flavin reductase (DIM6/NTAB) family NADH-FMN oxidoreductase RutF